MGVHVIKDFLPPDLVEELRLVATATATPGYRPRVTATTLQCSPPWAIEAQQRARRMIQNKVEDVFDVMLETFVETTVLVSWFPGAEIERHVDNGKPYLRQRHFSAVVWLNNDFCGGEFFYDLEDGVGEREIAFNPGDACVFSADITHGVRKVRSGVRQSLLVWLTKDQAACEDQKITPVSIANLTLSQKLFGIGPQETFHDKTLFQELLAHSKLSVTSSREDLLYTAFHRYIQATDNVPSNKKEFAEEKMSIFSPKKMSSGKKRMRTASWGNGVYPCHDTTVKRDEDLFSSPSSPYSPSSSSSRCLTKDEERIGVLSKEAQGWVVHGQSELFVEKHKNHNGQKPDSMSRLHDLNPDIIIRRPCTGLKNQDFTLGADTREGNPVQGCVNEDRHHLKQEQKEEEKKQKEEREHQQKEQKEEQEEHKDRKSTPIRRTRKEDDDCSLLQDKSLIIHEEKKRIREERGHEDAAAAWVRFQNVREHAYVHLVHGLRDNGFL